jgi:transposase
MVMSLQEDFVNKKPQLQHDLEARGHVCLFLPKFHCELNLIKLVWGYVKYCELIFSLNHLIIYGINVTGYRNILMANSVP